MLYQKKAVGYFVIYTIKGNKIGRRCFTNISKPNTNARNEGGKDIYNRFTEGRGGRTDFFPELVDQVHRHRPVGPLRWIAVNERWIRDVGNQIAPMVTVDSVGKFRKFGGNASLMEKTSTSSQN